MSQQQSRSSAVVSKPVVPATVTGRTPAPTPLDASQLRQVAGGTTTSTPNSSW